MVRMRAGVAGRAFTALTCRIDGTYAASGCDETRKIASRQQV